MGIKTLFFSFFPSFYRKLYKEKELINIQMVQDFNKTVKGLPVKGKRIFLKGFEKFKESGLSNEDSMTNALFTVGASYKQRGNEWALKQDINLNTAVIKEGGFFNPQYFFDATLSSDVEDSHGHFADKKLLSVLSEKGLIDKAGDIFHAGAKGFTSWKGLFVKGDHRMEGNKLKLRFNVDAKHPKFKQFLKLNKDHDFTKLSAEFYNPKMMGKRIIGATGLGWTLLPNGSNKDAKIEKRTKFA